MVKHPAKYNDKLLPVMDELLGDSYIVLDPFAGVGKIFKLLEYRRRAISAVEIEPEWGRTDDRIIVGDALNLFFSDGHFDAICTSPTYGNRMADSFNARDGSKRNTYHHSLGRRPTNGSSAVLQWGNKYREFHEMAWREVSRVLKNKGIFVLNIKDHIRCGEIQHVTDWHIKTIEALGFYVADVRRINVQSNRFGKNGKLRIGHESLIKFIKGERMDDFNKNGKLNAKGISPKLRPIDPKSVSASGLGDFKRDISDEKMQRIINENRVERLD